MYESLRGHRDFASFLSAVLKSAALAALVSGLSFTAFGQNGTTGTATATAATTGPSALFCTVPSSLPSSLSAAGTAVTPTGTTGASTITAIPVVTGSLIPGIIGTTLSCGTFGGAQSLQNLSFMAEGIVPIDFVLSPTAPVLPTETFATLVAGTTQLRDVVSLSGNTMTISLFSVPATAAFPTLMVAPATTVTPPGSLITQMTMQVSNAIITHGAASTMLFSGIVNPTTTSTTTGATTGTAAGTTATPTGAALVPNLFNISSASAASVSLAFDSGFTFPGLGATPATPNPGPFGLMGQMPSQTTMATMLTVTVAGNVTFASPTNFVTINTPATPIAFQTTSTGTTTGATTGTGGVH